MPNDEYDFDHLPINRAMRVRMARTPYASSGGESRCAAGTRPIRTLLIVP